MNFFKSKETYRKNATVQKKMAKKLIFDTTQKLGQNFDKILEIGSGTGFLTDEIYNNLKFSEIYLNDLTKNCTGHTPNAYFEGNFLDLKINEKFDLILSNAVFQWISDKKELFLKIRSLLKNGAHLCFTTFGEKNFIQIKEITGFSLDYKDPADLLKEAGFEVQYAERELQTLYFEDVRKILEHIRLTGVGANNECLWTKSKYEQFVKLYKENFTDKNGAELTYNPVYFICKAT